MADNDEVENFLRDLRIKLEIFGLFFHGNRVKNKFTLRELGLTERNVKDYLKELNTDNYSSGPINDTQNTGEYWVFGKDIKHKEIYIKINSGGYNNKVICISFHFSEYEINYPLKKLKNGK